MGDDRSVSNDKTDKDTVGADKLDDRLDRLGAALHERRRETESRAADSSGATGYAKAVRVSTDFIAGILVGAGIGWLIDKGLGTSPWGLIVFLLLGFCAGVMNVLRSDALATGPTSPSSDSGTGEDER